MTNKANSYIENGILYVRAACGHFVSDGKNDPDAKHLMCPNCSFLVRFQDIPITHPEQMPPEYRGLYCMNCGSSSFSGHFIGTPAEYYICLKCGTSQTLEGARANYLKVGEGDK